MSYDIHMYNKKSAFTLKIPAGNSLDIAVVFITTEGIQHQSGGVAKYIRNFIITLADMHKVFSDIGINMTLYACEPALLKILPTYSREGYEQIKDILEGTGGKFYKLINNTYGEDWIHHVENWKILSASAATIALNIAEKHQSTLVFFGSSCLAMTQVYIHKQLKTFDADVRTIYMTHDSAFSTFHKERNENILCMDYLCSQWTNFTPNAKIGYVSQFMKDLFKEKYMVPEIGFVPTRGGVVFDEERFKPLSKDKILQLLDKFDIPKEKRLIFSWGRPIDYKRLDLVFEAGKYIGEEIFPVVVTNGSYPALRQYIEQNGFRGKLIENYKGFELINALLCWENTMCTCLLSENEPGAIIPMEAMYMSHRRRSVVLTNSNGMYKELIEDGVNGFMVENDVEKIAEKLDHISMMSANELCSINSNAYSTIVNNFNQRKNYIETLSCAVPQIGLHRDKLLNYVKGVG